MAPRPHDGDEPSDPTPEGPGTPDGRPDLEREWADIVARLGDLEVPDAPDEPDGSTSPPSDRRPPAPEPGSPRDGADEVDAATAATPRVGRTGPESPADRTAPEGPRAWTPADPDDDHFEPPDPGPVLGGDPMLTMAWSVVVAVPALLVLSVVLRWSVPGVALQIGGALFLAAVAVLLWRMPHRRDDDGGPGAVV